MGLAICDGHYIIALLQGGCPVYTRYFRLGMVQYSAIDTISEVLYRETVPFTLCCIGLAMCLAISNGYFLKAPLPRRLPNFHQL